MQELRQSTEIKVRVGSAVDATDGVTPETTLTLGAADQAELLKHNGAPTVDISGRTFAAVTSVSGWYDLTLTTTDTNTLGQLTAVIQDSSLMAPIFRNFMVVTQQHWDSKYSTDTLQVDVTQWLGTAAATPTVAGVPEVDLTHLVGVAQSATDLKAMADLGYPAQMYNGTITGVTSQTVFTISDATLETDAFVGAEVIIGNGTIGTFLEIGSRRCTAYNATLGEMTIESAMPFTIVNDDEIRIIAMRGTDVAALATDVAALNDISTSDVNDQVVDVLRVDTIPDSYPTDGSQPTIAQALLVIQQILTEKSISGTTLTVKKPDGSSVAMTFTLSSATAPTSITRTT